MASTESIWPVGLTGTRCVPISRSPAADKQVLLAQDLVDLLERQPQLGGLGRRDLDEDRLLRRPERRYPAHTGDQDEFARQGVDVVIDLGEGVTVTGDREEQGVDIAEVVVDERGAGPGWQLPLHVGHLPSQLVPDLLEIVLGLGEGHLDLDLDQRTAHPSRPR
jgi:hypothetical protein